MGHKFGCLISLNSRQMYVAILDSYFSPFLHRHYDSELSPRIHSGSSGIHRIGQRRWTTLPNLQNLHKRHYGYHALERRTDRCICRGCNFALMDIGSDWLDWLLFTLLDFKVVLMHKKLKFSHSCTMMMIARFSI